MTGDTMRELLEPLIGKSGSISMLLSKMGTVTWSTAEDKKLVGVEIRPDGLLRLERDHGWAVIDPGEVVAVVWTADPETRPGQFL